MLFDHWYNFDKAIIDFKKVHNCSYDTFAEKQLIAA